MNHLDEGTIHAWLDGALNGAQSRDIEAHVASCPSCSAAVAEARGLIAGASRILAALDDTPSGVIPGSAAASPAAVSASLGSRRPAKRQWRAAPWVTGIAAVLVAAIVLTTGDVAMKASRADRSAVVFESLDSQAAAPTEGGVGSTRPAVTPAPDRMDAVSAPSAGRGTVAGVATVRDQAGGARKAETSIAERPVTIDSAATKVAALPVSAANAPDTTGARALGGGVQDTTRLRTTASRRVALEQVVVTALPESAIEAATLAGCYRLTANDAEKAQAAPAVAARGERRAAPGAAAAPSAGRAMDFSARGAPSIVRLDTTRSDSGFTVRPLRSDSVIGTWQVAGDTVRVDLGRYGMRTLLAVHRITCP